MTFVDVFFLNSYNVCLFTLIFQKHQSISKAKSERFHISCSDIWKVDIYLKISGYPQSGQEKMRDFPFSYFLFWIIYLQLFVFVNHSVSIVFLQFVTHFCCCFSCSCCMFFIKFYLFIFYIGYCKVLLVSLFKHYSISILVSYFGWYPILSICNIFKSLFSSSSCSFFIWVHAFWFHQVF